MEVAHERQPNRASVWLHCPLATPAISPSNSSITIFVMDQNLYSNLIQNSILQTYSLYPSLCHLFLGLDSQQVDEDEFGAEEEDQLQASQESEHHHELGLEAFDVFVEGESEEERGVEEGVEEEDPLKEANGDDAEEEGGDVAGEGVAVEAGDLSRGEGTSGKESTLHFMNLNRKYITRGTPTPKQ